MIYKIISRLYDRATYVRQIHKHLGTPTWLLWFLPRRELKERFTMVLENCYFGAKN